MKTIIINEFFALKEVEEVNSNTFELKGKAADNLPDGKYINVCTCHPEINGEECEIINGEYYSN